MTIAQQTRRTTIRTVGCMTIVFYHLAMLLAVTL